MVRVAGFVRRSRSKWLSLKLELEKFPKKILNFEVSNGNFYDFE